MLGNLIPSDGGAWLRYDAFGPPLAAYAADLTKGPVTVLWKGWIDAPHLQKFFADLARVVSANEKVRYRTRVLSRTDRDVVKSPDAPPLGRLAREARFVRFECATAASAEEPELRSFPDCLGQP